ncbi:heterokaryon incompatibility protein-domain-containing protein, partial [Leptodontidium sp. 2 PMI_412]
MNNGREAGEALPLLPQAARPQRKINLKLWKLWAIVAIFATLLVSVVVLLTRRPIPPLFYPPLDYSRDSLRLLQLHPGSGRQEIQSTISDVKFISNPTYSALSYTWGSPDRTNSIKVNGSRLQIRENLWNALHDLRDPKMTRVLWVDAICIDQNNVDEKNHQVPLMSFVYSRAQEVLIWLGEHKAPYWIESSAPSEWRDDWAVRKAKASWWTGATHAFLYGLVHEEYWKRAWIVQEVGMAPKTIRVHFGRQSIPWEEFMKLIRLYRAAAVGNVVNLENILKLDSL